MGVLDSYVTLGRETTYGTPATLSRSFEAEGDAHKRAMAYLRSSGMRAGLQAVRSDRSRAVNMGAAGTLPLTVLDKGFGMLFRAMMGASASALAPSASSAYLQTHNSDADGPAGESLTVQYARAPISGAVLPRTYHGGKVTSWELTQAIDAELKLSLSMDYEDEDKVTAAATATYPSGAKAFGWDQLAITIGGAAVDAKEFSLSGNNNLKTDRRQLRASALKKEPLRTGVPTFSGRLSIDYENDTQYDRFVAGSVHALVATWTGPTAIETTYFPYLKATLAAVQFTGESPEASNTDLPVQPLPFDVLWDGTNPAVAFEYQTADTTF